MHEQTQKIERKFIVNTVEEFTDWCGRKKCEPSLENYTVFLMTHNYIPNTQVRRAFVVFTVPEISFCRGISKTKAVMIIEDEYGIPERTVFQLLKEHRNTFHAPTKKS